RFVHRLFQEQKDPSFASELIHPSAVNLLWRVFLWMLCISFVSVVQSEFPDFVCDLTVGI
ncbi:unnamed protein product, partial [Linum tenue]